MQSVERVLFDNLCGFSIQIWIENDSKLSQLWCRLLIVFFWTPVWFEKASRFLMPLKFVSELQEFLIIFYSNLSWKLSEFQNAELFSPIFREMSAQGTWLTVCVGGFKSDLKKVSRFHILSNYMAKIWKSLSFFQFRFELKTIQKSECTKVGCCSCSHDSGMHYPSKTLDFESEKTSHRCSKEHHQQSVSNLSDFSNYFQFKFELKRLRVTQPIGLFNKEHITIQAMVCTILHSFHKKFKNSRTPTQTVDRVLLNACVVFNSDLNWKTTFFTQNWNPFENLAAPRQSVDPVLIWIKKSLRIQ